jgi:hypothetical protein
VDGGSTSMPAMSNNVTFETIVSLGAAPPTRPIPQSIRCLMAIQSDEPCSGAVSKINKLRVGVGVCIRFSLEFFCNLPFLTIADSLIE